MNTEKYVGLRAEFLPWEQNGTPTTITIKRAETGPTSCVSKSGLVFVFDYDFPVGGIKEVKSHSINFKLLDQPTEKLQFDKYQIFHVYKSFQTWMDITNNYEISFADLLHSSLLKRLLKGEEVMPEEEYKEAKKLRKI